MKINWLSCIKKEETKIRISNYVTKTECFSGNTVTKQVYVFLYWAGIKHYVLKKSILDTIGFLWA